MYTPEPNTSTVWVFQDGKPAFTGQFNDTGTIRNFSDPATIITRYDDPRPALRDRPEVAPGEDIEALIQSPRGLVYFRFRLDPLKGELAGLLNAAGRDPNNLWHIESPENLEPLTALRQAMDFAACGDVDELRRAYAGAVGKPGGATSPELEQLRRKLAEALAERDKAVADARASAESLNPLRAELSSAKKNLADALAEIQASAAGMKRAAGMKPRGQYQQALAKSAEGLEKLVAAYRQK